MSKVRLFFTLTTFLILALTLSGLAEKSIFSEEKYNNPVPAIGLCSFVNDPSEFAHSPEQNQATLSKLAGSVASRVRPIITRSAPLSPVKRNNFIDEHIFTAIEGAGIEASSLSSDTEFLRRVMLDLTGRIPSADQVTNFVNDRNPSKRNTLIDGLVTTQEYVDKWTMFFGDLLKVNWRASNINRYSQGRDAFHLYLKNAISQNKPYDQLLRELLTAEGDNHSSGSVNYLVGGRIPMGPIQDTFDGQATQLAAMFLGVQVVDCVLCHDGKGRLESVNLWGSMQTRANMWGLSAFFSKTRIRSTRITLKPRLTRYYLQSRNQGYVLNTTEGNRSPREPQAGGRVVEPLYPFSITEEKAPGRVVGRVPPGKSRREALADYVVKDIQFARAAVNYIWEELMIQAFVTPSNAFDLARLDPDNPPPAPWTLQPTNPRLLEALATWFQQNNFDIRQLISLIANSRAYQLSAVYPTEWKQEYVPYYARRFVRRLDAEEIHDAVIKATGVPAKYELRSNTGSTLGPFQWAMQFPDTKEPSRYRWVRDFLNSFGRGDRDLNKRESSGSTLQALNLLNHFFVMSRIDARKSTSTIGLILAKTSDPKRIIQEMYLSTLSRFPTPQEEATLVPMIVQLGPASGAEALQWSLINKMDFVFNY